MSISNVKTALCPPMPTMSIEEMGVSSSTQIENGHSPDYASIQIKSTSGATSNNSFGFENLGMDIYDESGREVGHHYRAGPGERRDNRTYTRDGWCVIRVFE